jgi:hypothetical protein
VKGDEKIQVPGGNTEWMKSNCEVILLEHLAQEYDEATYLISVLASISQARIRDP